MHRLAPVLVIALAFGCGNSNGSANDNAGDQTDQAATATATDQAEKAEQTAAKPTETTPTEADVPAEPTEKDMMSIEAPADVAAPPADAEKTASGLASRVLRPGTGTTHPTAADKVTVHYVGWTVDGKRFDSSVERGQPATFPLGHVIPGWTEGVQLMVEGERRRFWIPADLAYGEHPARPGAPAGMLVFDIELIHIN
ncbi:MAG TPA: FKBP-type peptidyl-prolyl cis-trans isomerase [Kofleriaceae bacterium]|nr:FKBP-type peptidyl-prolyl cis-trans isomerase [Kofleriaceae bacterium]